MKIAEDRNMDIMTVTPISSVVGNGALGVIGLEVAAA